MKDKIYSLLTSEKISVASYLFGAFASIFFISSYHWEPVLKRVFFLNIHGVIVFAVISLIPAAYNLIRLICLRLRKETNAESKKSLPIIVLHFLNLFIAFGMFTYGLLVFLRVGNGITSDELKDIVNASALMAPVTLLAIGVPAILFASYLTSGKKRLALRIAFFVLCLATGFAFVPAASSYVADYYTCGDYSEVELSDDFEEELNADVFANTADVRILLANLLVDSKEKPAKPRAKKFISLVKAYRPDIICVQEMSQNWCSLIANNLLDDNGYKMMNPTWYYAAKREIALIYNSSMLNLIDSGSFSYTAGNGLQRMAWGVFEVKSTGKKFIASSTHLSFISAGSEASGLKVTCSEAKEMLDKLEKLEKKYNCPVIAAGDYNSRDNIYVSGIYSEVYSQLTKTLKDSKYNCENALVGDAKDHIDVVKNEDCKTLDVADIDHILFRGAVEAKTYLNMSYTYLDDMSDHYAVLTDMALK